MNVALIYALQDLADALSLDKTTLLENYTAAELQENLFLQLKISLPTETWSLQYQHDNQIDYLVQVETDLNLREKQHTALSELVFNDDTGLFTFCRDLVLMELIRLYCIRQYESVDQASVIKRRVRDCLAAVIPNCSDAMYQQWRDWKHLLIEAIEQQQASLPHINYIERNVSLPAVVLAYQLYDDIEREQDIVNRNHIAHPLFCPIAQPMEVLSK